MGQSPILFALTCVTASGTPGRVVNSSPSDVSPWYVVFDFIDVSPQTSA